MTSEEISSGHFRERISLCLGRPGFADALLQTLFSAVAFTPQFFVTFNFFVSHIRALLAYDRSATPVAHTAVFVKGLLFSGILPKTRI
jgi:hypothetical protein